MLPCISVATLKHVKDRVLATAESKCCHSEVYYTATLAELRAPSERHLLCDSQHSSLSSVSEYHDCAEEAHLLPSMPMYSPGWQIHLSRKWASCCPCFEWFHQVLFARCFLDRFVIIARTPPSKYFNTMRLSTTMWFDHFPFAYQYVCESYAERLMRTTAANSAVIVNQHGQDDGMAMSLREVTRYLQSKG